jgi:hypothetical protein
MDGSISCGEIIAGWCTYVSRGTYRWGVFTCIELCAVLRGRRGTKKKHGMTRCHRPFESLLGFGAVRKADEWISFALPLKKKLIWWMGPLQRSLPKNSLA